MLTLGRTPGKYVVINGNIFVKLVLDKDGNLGFAIEAPKDVHIVRGELYEQTNPVPDCIKRFE